jgi:hypothetical protein
MQSKNPHAICGAKTRNGKPCQSKPMTNGRCRMHGGATPVGAALPQFKTGRYSQHLPENLLSAYQRSETDSELLGIRAEISLLDSMLISNLSKLETGESGKAWSVIRKSIDGVDKAFANENYGEVMVLLRQMRDVVDQKIEHYATEEEIRSKIEQRRRLVESEGKRLVQMQQMIDSSEAMTLISALLDSVIRNVTDSNTITAIQSDFGRIVGIASLRRVNTPSE